MKKEHWLILGNAYEQVFPNIAKLVGEKHPLYAMMGQLAWGRHNWEMGPMPTLQGAIRRAAALEGVFQTLNLWARDNAPELQRKMLAIWDEKRWEGMPGR